MVSLPTNTAICHSLPLLVKSNYYLSLGWLVMLVAVNLFSWIRSICLVSYSKCLYNLSPTFLYHSIAQRNLHFLLCVPQISYLQYI